MKADRTETPHTNIQPVLNNIMVGLSVSIVAITLGAAFGILSGRGALAGMVSASIIAFITSAFGGTRVQCSGPTAPMSAVVAVVVAYAYSQLPSDIAASGVSADQFINIVLIISGLLMMLMAVLRLGRFINLIPPPVITGFMNGIALIIIVNQLSLLLGLAGKTPLEGSLTWNISVAVITLLLTFLLPIGLKAIFPRAERYFPGTLMALAVMTCATALLDAPIERVSLPTTISGWQDMSILFADQLPPLSALTPALFLLALPFALELSTLAYLDTLLTATIIDRLRGEPTKRNRELAAQGLANGAVAFAGGIPGAQATMQSVLLHKEGATMRLAGMAVGIWILLEMLLMLPLIGMIPRAVFVGVLLKVSWNVSDLDPLIDWWKHRTTTYWNLPHAARQGATPDNAAPSLFDVSIICGTALTTVLVELNAAVIGFTALYYILHLLRKARRSTSTTA